jgi:hypothetical protein
MFCLIGPGRISASVLDARVERPRKAVQLATDVLIETIVWMGGAGWQKPS